MTTLETAKPIRELYFRGLEDKQSNYIKDLQVLFNVNKPIEAARRALYGYVDMRKAYEAERIKTAELLQNIRQLEEDVKKINGLIKTHFELEDKVTLSKQSLIQLLTDANK